MGTWRQKEVKQKALEKQKQKLLIEFNKYLKLNREKSLLFYDGIKTKDKKLVAFFSEDFVDEDNGEVISIERLDVIPLLKEFTEKDLNILTTKFDKFLNPKYYGK